MTDTNTTESRQTRPLAQRILIALVLIIVLAASVFCWYVSDSYRADQTALACMADANGDADGVVVRTLADDAYAFVPAKPSAGLVFYPGGKVQAEAYAPLMERCAKRGIVCVVVAPPYNLAVLGPNAADGVREQFPEVARWAVGGHSLGGVVASDYLSRHEDSFVTLVLLAAYPSVDLTAFSGGVLQVVGTNDGVINRQRYDEAHALLPPNATELVLEGGNHAQYGNYGAQAGDGTATISADEQQEQTARAIQDALS